MKRVILVLFVVIFLFGCSIGSKREFVIKVIPEVKNSKVPVNVDPVVNMYIKINELKSFDTKADLQGEISPDVSILPF